MQWALSPKQTVPRRAASNHRHKPTVIGWGGRVPQYFLELAANNRSSFTNLGVILSSIYSISITGIKSGFSKEIVTKQLSDLLNVSAEKAAAILDSSKYSVKGGVDLKTSAKYEAALQSTGCTCIVEPEQSKTEILTFDLPETGTRNKEEVFHKELADRKDDQALKPVETTAAGITITNDQKVTMAVVFTLVIGFFVYIGTSEDGGPTELETQQVEEPMSAPPEAQYESQQSSADIEACEYAKERCYEKSGAMVQMCLNALGAVRGCL